MSVSLSQAFGISEGQESHGAATQDYPVANITWPDSKFLSLRDSLERFGHTQELSDFERLVNQLRHLEEMVPAPIVAILGSLNGGKSSLVASLLSVAGRDRVPRGIDPQFGTHRFVFWVPKKWDDRAAGREFWNSIENQLATTFGSAVEFLSEDPTTASAQYNGNSEVAQNFSTPLIAFDERLDELNLCLLDCPDVESRVGDQRAADRMAVVERASETIHGVVYVVDTADVRSDLIAELANVLNNNLAMLPKFLAINKVRQSHSAINVRVIKEDVVALRNALGANEVFAAYDFEASSNAGQLPANAAQQVVLPEGVPWFFKPRAEESEDAIPEVQPDEMLVSHLRQLKGGALWEKSIEGHRRLLASKLRDLRKNLDRSCSEHRSELIRIHGQMFEFIKTQMTDSKGELKIPYTAGVLSRVSESFLQVAPLYARPALYMNHGIGEFRAMLKRGRDTVGMMVRGITNPAESAINHATVAITAKLRDERGDLLFEPADFARKFKCSGINVRGASDNDLELAWRGVLHSIQSVSDELRPEELNDATRDIWTALPLWRKLVLGAAAPVLVVAGLASICVAVVDLGTSAVILTSSTSQLLALLGIGGTGAVAGLVGVARLDDVLKRRVGVPAFCRMLASAFDVFSLPREVNGPVWIEFPGIPRQAANLGKYPSIQTAARLTDCILAEEVPKGWDELNKIATPSHLQ